MSNKLLFYSKAYIFNMIYFLYNSYSPNTAISNRMLAYFHGIENAKVPITAVFFLTDKERSKIPYQYEYVSIIYCWERFFINHRIFKYLSYLFYLLRFVSRLKKGDIIYVYGNNDICKFVSYKKGVDIYLEQTECPEVFMSGNQFFKISLENHLKLCKRVKGLIVISNELRKYYIDHGVEADRIKIVNMIVDPTRFLNLRKDNNSEKYIAYCGTVSNTKDGVDVLLKAFNIVHKKYNLIKLYIIGEIPSKSDKLGNIKLIREFGLEDSVVFTGRVSAERMPQMLKNAQVLALSRPNNMQAQYGFPTKLGEYLLTENPVVVTSVGDIPLFLKDKESAIIVRPDSPDSFAEGMIWVMKHNKESEEIGVNGKNIALANFDSLKETKKLINILKS